MGRAREIADLIGGTTPDIILKTSDGAILNLQTSDTTVTADSVLGAINFQAPDEADGTDSILIASKIEAIAEGTFSASSNATSLVFSTASSAAAGTVSGKMTFTSGGNLIIKDTDTADGSSPTITLQTGDTDIAANDVLGSINFQAPDEGTGTDAILVAAGIEAVSEGDFSSSSNATKLVFKTGASETAASKMTLSSGGVLNVDGGITVDNITIDGQEIDVSSGDLTLDVAGDIILDADGGDVNFLDGGVVYGFLAKTNDDLLLGNSISDGDVLIRGNDGGSNLTAAFFDMSDAGTFRSGNIGTANPGSGSEGTIIVNGQGGILITGGTSGNVTALRIYSTNSGVTTASISALGALSKTSGSFKIKHPLPSKTQTHHLVHSFVEAPEAANIYRGKVALSSGTATVNLDTSSGMSEGSFESLNRDVQCFTSNETGWTAVKGAVSFLSYDFQLEDGSGSLVDESGNTLITEGVHSNILTITAQDNSCTDTISWLVVGQRHDSHMYETDWTDTHGRVIVEPLQIPKEEYDYRLGK